MYFWDRFNLFPNKVHYNVCVFIIGFMLSCCKSPKQKDCFVFLYSCYEFREVSSKMTCSRRQLLFKMPDLASVI